MEKEEINKENSTYDISTYGFLSETDGKLPEDFSIYKNIISNINSNILLFKDSVEELSNKNYSLDFYKELVEKQTSYNKKKIFSLFTFICQKYLFEEKTTDVLPSCIGIPWYYSSIDRDLPLVVTYDAIILNNWIFEDDSEINNIKILRNLSNTKDEEWFYRIHVMIEMCGAKVLPLMIKKIFNLDELKDVLILLADVLERCNCILSLMYSKCDKKIFNNVFRKYLSGTNSFENGISIESLNKKFSFVGGSAAQSTLIQSFDIFLGVTHEGHEKYFLEKMRSYMPINHRKYLQKLIDNGGIKQHAILCHLSGREDIKEIYDNCLLKLKKFRNTHINIVHKYIVDFIDINNILTEKGKGGIGKFDWSLIMWIINLDDHPIIKNLKRINGQRRNISTRAYKMILIGIFYMILIIPIFVFTYYFSNSKRR